jgi:chloride channel protein, CIC family
MRLSAWLDRLQPSGSLVLGAAAVGVGLASGIGVWLFKQFIVIVHAATFDGAARSSGWIVVVIPVVGGLVVGLLVHFLIGEERHHGVAGVMEAVALAGGRLRYQRMPFKAIASGISIGVGASVGPEDPSVQIGASLGSMVGQWLRLSDDRMRALVAAGAAGGISAAFNAPIAGVFFALELVLGEMGSHALGAIVLASVLSSVFTQVASGAQPAFRVPAYAFHSAWELPLYLVLGLLSGPVAAAYIWAVYWVQDLFHAWHMYDWIKPAVAGLGVGVVGLFLPQVFGVGYDTIEQILAGAPLAVWMLLALLVAKLVLTPVSLGGGFKGGVFAPSLFLGAALGGAYGIVAQRLLPSLNLTPAAFAMVGMAAVLAGTVHAPLTAIVLLFEMTNDYRIILPLMFAVVVSLLVSQRLRSDSVYIHGLARKGIRLERGRDVEVMQGITVGEVMEPETPVLRESDTLGAASDMLSHTRRYGLPVLDAADQLVGIITLQDIDKAHAAGHDAKATVGEVASRDLQTVYPDETLAAAIRRMGMRDVGRLPVVSRNEPGHMVGLLRRSDVMRAYDIALTRRAAMRHQASQVRLGAFGGLSVEELVVAAGSACAGQAVSQVPWPRECVIASLRRGRRVMIPRGDTILRPGDVLVVVAEGEARETARKLARAA